MHLCVCFIRFPRLDSPTQLLHAISLLHLSTVQIQSISLYYYQCHLNSFVYGLRNCNSLTNTDGLNKYISLSIAE